MASRSTLKRGERTEEVRQVAAARKEWEKERSANPLPATLAPKHWFIIGTEQMRHDRAQKLRLNNVVLQTTSGHEVNFSQSAVKDLSPGEATPDNEPLQCRF